MKIILDDKYIRFRMKERRIGSVRQLALQAGMHPNGMYKVLRHASDFRVSTLAALADTLQTEPAKLLRIQNGSEE